MHIRTLLLPIAALAFTACIDGHKSASKMMSFKDDSSIAGSSENEETSTFESGLSTDQALCRKSLPNLDEMRSELEKMTTDSPTGNTGVGGLSLKNENPQLIQAYRFLTSYKTYKFTVDKDIDHWDLFKDGTCDKALCAAETIFGKDDGVLYLYIAAKYGLVLSSLGMDKLRAPTPEAQLKFDAYYTIRPWKDSELGAYLKALPMLPPVGLPLPFTRFHQAGIVNPLNPNVLSNGIILFYSSINGFSDSQKEQTTYHEIGHNYGSTFGLDTSKEWLAASGWIRGDDNQIINSNPAGFVSEYAKKDFFEDFAESFTYYRYYPARLKARSPERYEYLKTKVYFGREYLDASQCQ